MKTYQAKICLFCDEIYNSNWQCCPKCTEEKFLYLRDIKVGDESVPLFSPQELKEVRNEKSSLSLQMVTPSKRNPDLVFSIDKYGYVNSSWRSGHEPQANQPSRFAPDYKPEPPTAETGTGNHTGGVRVERESSVKQGSNRLDAGIARIGKVLRWYFGSQGSLLPGDKYRGGYEDSEILSAYKS
jgi:predicted  nucleic acid-binding Zn-ribbon protein